LGDHADTAMGECLTGLGVDLTGVDDWTEEQEREVLARPDALDCMLDHVPAEERPDLLERAFPEDPDTRGRQDYLDQVVAVVSYAQDRSEETDLDTMADLLEAFELTGFDTHRYVRNAIAVHLAPGGPEAFEEWRETYEHEDTIESQIRFAMDQFRNGSPVGHAIRDIRDKLYELTR
jgi:hypothetical protein